MQQKQTHKLTLQTKALLAFVFLAGATTLFAYTSPGKPGGFVNDFAHVMSAGAKSQLETELSEYSKLSTNEISVVTIKSLEGNDIESYANTLFREWGIGSKEKNNGVLLLLAIDDRRLRIEVGYGLEGALPDLATYNIEQKNIVPRLKEGNYDQAVIEGVHEIIGTLKGEIPIPDDYPKQSSGFPGALWQFIPFLVLFGVQILFGILAPTKSWWLGGVLGGVVGGVLGFIFSSVVLGTISAVFLALLGLVFDYLVSRSYQARGKDRKDFWTHGGFWGGGMSGGGGGSSFGGFGGGSSGGGGSSSSWFTLLNNFKSTCSITSMC